jgi:hypothetical protein
VVLAALVVIGLPQVAHADFINLVSQSYQVHDIVFGCCPPLASFNETSATPISRSDNSTIFNASGGFNGGIRVFASATGGVTPLSAFTQAQTDAADFVNAVVAEVGAAAAITFRPLVTDLVVQVLMPPQPGGGEPRPCPCLGQAGLFDETAGAAVLAFPPYGSFPTPVFNVSLNADHVYRIYASELGGYGQREVMLSIAPANVPESDSTLTFLVVGLGALLLIARARRSVSRASGSPGL